MAGKDVFPWFRMYTEARNDAKLRTLTSDQFRVWFNLLCLAAESGMSRSVTSSHSEHERGVVTVVTYELLAIEVSNGDEEVLVETIAKLEKLHIIQRMEDGALAFVNFDKRQYDNPSDTPAATRQRKARSRARHDMSRDVTDKRRIEESREEENIQARSGNGLLKIAAGKEGQTAAVLAAAAGSEKQNSRTQNAVLLLADLPATLTEKFNQGQIEKEFDKWQSWVADHPKSNLTLKQFLSWMDKVRPEDVIPPHETDVQRLTRIIHSKPNEKGLLDGPDENGRIDRQTYTVWEDRLRAAKRLEETRARQERSRERAAIEALYANSDETELVQDESGNHKTPT